MQKMVINLKQFVVMKLQFLTNKINNIHRLPFAQRCLIMVLKLVRCCWRFLVKKEYLIRYFDNDSSSYVNSYWYSDTAEDAEECFKRNMKSNYSDIPSQYSVYELVHEVN